MKLLREFKIGTILLIALVISIQCLAEQDYTYSLIKQQQDSSDMANKNTLSSRVPGCMVSIPKKAIMHEYNNVSSLPKQQQYAVFVAAMISLSTPPDSTREIMDKMPDPFVMPRDLYPPAESKPKASNIGGGIPADFASIADVGAPPPVALPSQVILTEFWYGYDSGASDRKKWYDPSYYFSDMTGIIRKVYNGYYMGSAFSDPCKALAYGYHFGLQELTDSKHLNLQATIPCLDWYHYVKNNNIRTLPNQ